MISVDKACEIATKFHNEPFVEVITDIGKGFVVGTASKDGEVSDTPPVYIEKANGKAQFFFIPDHFAEMKKGEKKEVPNQFKYKH